MPGACPGAVREGVAEFVAAGFGECEQAFHDVRMGGGDVGGFRDVILQVVECRAGQLGVFVAHGLAACAAGASVQGAVEVGQHEFPAAIAADHGLQFVLRIPQSVAGVWRSGVWLAGEQWPHVASVDR